MEWYTVCAWIMLIGSVGMTAFYGLNFFFVYRKEAKINAARLIGFYLTSLVNAIAHGIVAVFYVEYYVYGDTKQ